VFPVVNSKGMLAVILWLYWACAEATKDKTASESPVKMLAVRFISPLVLILLEADHRLEADSLQ
jgi:hypothetical protein